MSDPHLPITGGCLCKAVRYSVSAPPLLVRQCWCRDCQFWASGSATVNVVFATDAVSLTGALTHFVSIADQATAWCVVSAPRAGRR